jgi:hypothetical protein
MEYVDRLPEFGYIQDPVLPIGAKPDFSDPYADRPHTQAIGLSTIGNI